MPVIDMVTDDKAERISFLKMRSFWVLEVNDLPLDMTSFELVFSPGLGPSYAVRLFFDEKQPFVFYADLRPGENVPFDEFLIFFSVAISSKKLSFSFDDECYKENPIDGLRTFLNSFDDQYVLWALAFISSQPWISLFKYNEELSSLLTGLVTNLVSKFFFEEESQHKEVDLRPVIGQRFVTIAKADAQIAKHLKIRESTPVLQYVGLVWEMLEDRPAHTSYQIGYGEQMDFEVGDYSYLKDNEDLDEYFYEDDVLDDGEELKPGFFDDEEEFNREFNSIEETNPKMGSVILPDFDEKREPQNVVKINVEIDENGNLKITDFKKRK